MEDKTIKTSIKGITKKGNDIYVRFSFQSVRYPVKNFTKLFGCKTVKSAETKLNEIKKMISEGKNPFIQKVETLDEYFYSNLERKKRVGEWRERTCDQYTYFYESLISNKNRKDPQSKISIGHKRMNKITYDNLMEILYSIEETQGSWKSRLKQLLNPLFKEALKRKHIIENPVELLPIHEVGKRPKLSSRVKDDNLTIAKKLYKAIPRYKTRERIQIKQTQYFFYMLLMTAHRYGEILQLKKSDIYMKEKMIIARKETTKTKEEYIYPFPKEMKKYLETIDDNDLIFPNLKHGSMYSTFLRLVKESGINLYRGKKMSIHDTRSMMLNIMIRNCNIDSRLADSCLEHKQNNVIDHYLDFDFKDKKKAYKKYWKIIRENNDY